jgi:hypothetical protein
VNPEVKAEWVKRLRSGDYAQGEGYLHQIFESGEQERHEFCCLGVLCEIAVEVGVTTVSPSTGTEKQFSYGGGDTHPPSEVVRWAGLRDSSGDLGRRVKTTAKDGEVVEEDLLVNLNDGGVPFDRIADIIEEHL